MQRRTQRVGGFPPVAVQLDAQHCRQRHPLPRRCRTAAVVAAASVAARIQAAAMCIHTAAAVRIHTTAATRIHAAATRIHAATTGRTHTATAVAVDARHHGHR
eukprot:206033-Chlamydomonas_euryale.AAC.3